MTTPNSTVPGFPPIINPGEPFAYLPPDFARQFHNYQYVNAAAVGVSRSYHPQCGPPDDKVQMFTWELFYDL